MTKLTKLWVNLSDIRQKTKEKEKKNIDIKHFYPYGCESYGSRAGTPWHESLHMEAMLGEEMLLATLENTHLQI